MNLVKTLRLLTEAPKTTDQQTSPYLNFLFG